MYLTDPKRNRGVSQPGRRHASSVGSSPTGVSGSGIPPVSGTGSFDTQRFESSHADQKNLPPQKCPRSITERTETS